MSYLQCGDRRLDLSRPQVMGILNVTPDSFSDGGRFVGGDAAQAHAGRMVEAGATIIDIGGESTRPGAQPVDAAAELDRVLPVLESVLPLDVVVSVDTMKTPVMREAIRAGSDYLVVGRPIRDAEDPVAAAQAIQSEIAGALSKSH